MQSNQEAQSFRGRSTPRTREAHKHIEGCHLSSPDSAKRTRFSPLPSGVTRSAVPTVLATSSVPTRPRSTALSRREQADPVSALLPPACIIPQPVKSKLEPKDWFIIPSWASSIQLKQDPLPNGRDFSILVQPFRNALTLLPKQSGTCCAVSSEAVKIQLRSIDPNFFSRHGTKRWKDCLPKAQAFVAVHLTLPPLLKRDLKRCQTEYLLFEDISLPYYSREVQSPAFDAQTAKLCIEFNLQSDAWLQRTIARPLQAFSARQSHQRRSYVLLRVLGPL